MPVLLVKVSKEANSVYPDQTVPALAVRFGCTLFVEETSNACGTNIRADSEN